ncbi:MAG: methyltransferase domain-containing protein [Rhizobiales bacterium]|nr:methyltransferase domain-containing protein [Hyphomicrobiales bacterium]
MNDNRPFDRALAIRRRIRALEHGTPPDFLHARVMQDFVERLGAINRRFGTALVLGAGSASALEALDGRFGIETLIASERDLRLARSLGTRAIVTDEEALACGEASLDLVVSPFGLQDVNDLPGALVQIRRALRPDGLALLAVAGGETLGELRAAFLSAEAEVGLGASPHVAPMLDVREAGALLQRAGFALPVADRETITVRYRHALTLLADLRAMGATNTLFERSRSFLPASVLTRMVENYTRDHGEPDGRVSATVEILTMTGWAPDPSQQKPLRPGSARMRLADALTTRDPPEVEDGGTPRDPDADGSETEGGDR